MHWFVGFAIAIAASIDFLATEGIVPRQSVVLVEILSGLALVIALIRGLTHGLGGIRPAYWWMLGICVLHAVLGVIANGVDPGAVFSGIRNFARSVPFFLLGAMYGSTERQTRAQAMLLLFIALVQLPIALYQSGLPGVTGDAITGSLTAGSQLGPYLLAVFSVLLALYLLERLSLASFLLLAGLVLAPAAINETKALFLMLPATVLLVAVVALRPDRRLRVISAASALLVAGFGALAVTYEATQKEAETYVELGEFFSADRLREYLITDADLGATRTHVGRFDAMAVPVQFISRDSVTLLFGVGVGNASQSFLGPRFDGEFGPMFVRYIQYSAVRIVLETGLVGLALALVLFVLLYRDALFVARHGDRFHSHAALAWIGVLGVFLMSFFYGDVVKSAVLSVPMWWIGGVMSRQRQLLAARADPAVAQRRPSRRPTSRRGRPLVPVVR